MKNIITFLFAILICLSVAKAQNPTADNLLENTIKDAKIVGITAGYTVNGKTVWQKSKGYSNREKEIAFTNETITRMASIAKPMTAIAIMQLVENELIDLDLPIQTYIPEFPIKKEGTITTRQLLSHTSGIDGYQSSKETESQVEYSTLTDAMTTFQDRKLRFTPGSEFYYTTYGYVVLGRIIETVSGQTYEDYMQVNIWDKADMTNTGIEKFNETYQNKSALYHKNKRKAKLKKKNNLSNRTPGGGFYTTLGDLLNFGNAVIENKLIEAASLELLTRNTMMKKDGNPYGYGFYLYGPTDNKSGAFGHSGEQTGTASHILIIPETKRVAVVLSNTSGTWKDVFSLTIQLMNLSKESKPL